MAYMPLANVYPNMYVPYVQHTRRPLIESDANLLLIVEVIDYSLRCHNLHNWAPTWNLDFLRINNPFTYFNENFAATVISPNIEEQAILLANRLGFNVRTWLELADPEEARRCQEYYLLGMFHYNRPYLFHMFSLACYASRMALQRNRNSLVNDVAWALLLAIRKTIPYEEYYREFYFVANMNDDHHVDDGEPLDDDEGIGDAADADNSSRENNGSLSLLSTDPIVLFVKEVIDYYLRYNSFPGLIPPEYLPNLRSAEIGYFDENLGNAITHHCSDRDAIQVAREWGFEEERWLLLYRPSEARNFQDYFLKKVFHPSEQNMIRMLSFACYTCKIAKQINRDSLVDAVEWALVNFLRTYFPDQPYYRALQNHAIEYNDFHYYLHSQSEDEGADDAASEVVSSEESNAADSSEEGTASHSDNDQNEAEERNNAQFVMVGDEEKEGSEIDTSTERNETDVLEEGSGKQTLEERSGMQTSGKADGSDTSEKADGSDILES